MLLHIIYIYILDSTPGSTDSCIALFTVKCGVCQHTGAGSGMCFPTPQQRGTDHLFSPSGDHKTLTRMCVKCSIVCCFPLVCRPVSFSFLSYVFSLTAISRCLTSILHWTPPPTHLHFLLSGYRSKQCVPQKGVGTQICCI